MFYQERGQCMKKQKIVPKALAHMPSISPFVLTATSSANNVSVKHSTVWMGVHVLSSQTASRRRQLSNNDGGVRKMSNNKFMLPLLYPLSLDRAELVVKHYWAFLLKAFFCLLRNLCYSHYSMWIYRIFQTFLNCEALLNLLSSCEASRLSLHLNEYVYEKKIQLPRDSLYVKGIYGICVVLFFISEWRSHKMKIERVGVWKFVSKCARVMPWS